jgi:hypothetical protein
MNGSDCQQAIADIISHVAIDFNLDTDPADTVTKNLDAYYNGLAEAAAKCRVTINQMMNHLALDDQHFSYIYRLIMDKHKITDSSDLQSVLVAAAQDGIINLIRPFVDRMDQETMNAAMLLAAKNGHIDIVRLMLRPVLGYFTEGKNTLSPNDPRKGADNYNEAIEYAASNKHMDVVELINKHLATL